MYRNYLSWSSDLASQSEAELAKPVVFGKAPPVKAMSPLCDAAWWSPLVAARLKHLEMVCRRRKEHTLRPSDPLGVPEEDESEAEVEKVK